MVRGVLWLTAFGGAAFLLGIPLEVTLRDMVLLGALWVAGLVGLRTPRAFVFTRYALTVADAAVVAGGVAALRGPLGAVLPDASYRPALDSLVRAYVPPLVVIMALSGMFRVDPRPAVVAGVLAAGTFVYYANRFEVTPAEWGLLGIIVVCVAVSVTMARVVRYISLRALEQEAIADYVPESLTRELETTGTLDRAGRLETLTLFVCDIRGFTRRSEGLAPADTLAFVNMYLDAVCPPIAAAGGVIDKFMGDGVLAFFEGGGNAARAMSAARAALRSVERLQVDAPIRIGIALHTGPVLVGTVGPRTRREYTIISDAVNTVSRLEELNKTHGSSIVASAETMEDLDEADRQGFQGPIEARIRGREAAVMVYVL